MIDRSHHTVVKLPQQHVNSIEFCFISLLPWTLYFLLLVGLSCILLNPLIPSWHLSFWSQHSEWFIICSARTSRSFTGALSDTRKSAIWGGWCSFGCSCRARSWTVEAGCITGTGKLSDLALAHFSTVFSIRFGPTGARRSVRTFWRLWGSGSWTLCCC